MEKAWLKHYQKDVPPEINPDRYASLVELAEESFKNYAQLAAFSCMGKTISYAELNQQSQELACYFLEVLNLQKGDRVAIMLPNILQYPVALHAVLRAGLTVVNVNPLYTARELEHQLKDSGAKVILILENFAHVLAQVLSQTRIEQVLVTRLGDQLDFPKSFVVNLVVKYIKKMVPKFSIPKAISMRLAQHLGQNKAFRPHKVSGNDIAFLQYTGGTTGVSKGAMLTHRNLVANIEQAHAWIKPEVKVGQEIIITALPLYHIFSLTANCLTFMKLGGHNILIPNPRDLAAFIKELKSYKFTVITGVNTLFNALLNHKDFQSLDFSTLRLTLGGGMAVQKAVADRWKKVTKIPLSQAYGLTETSPAACMNPLNLQEFNGAIGLPISSTEAIILDDDGKPVAVHEAGELCFRGPQVMKGYWQRDDETKKVFTSDGWFKTGDIAKVDEKGFFTIVDRKKDMILVSGFNVYPNEVEEVVTLHDGILEAAAIGVPDDKSGEAVKVYAVKKDPNLTVEAVIEHCRKHLTGYKVPKYVEWRNDLPKTNVGKILRRSLKEPVG